MTYGLLIGAAATRHVEHHGGATAGPRYHHHEKAHHDPAGVPPAPMTMLVPGTPGTVPTQTTPSQTVP